jgi:hypothetical protein
LAILTSFFGTICGHPKIQCWYNLGEASFDFARHLGQNGIDNIFLGYSVAQFGYAFAFTVGAIVAIPIIILIEFIKPCWKNNE